MKIGMEIGMEVWRYGVMKIGSGYLRHMGYVCGECFTCIWLFCISC